MKLDKGPSLTDQKSPVQTEKATHEKAVLDAEQDNVFENKKDTPRKNPGHKNKTKTKSQEDEDLGIYEDTDDGDDLTDTEIELEKLREEKRKLDEDKRKEGDKQVTVGADGRHVTGASELSIGAAEINDGLSKDRTFVTGGGMELEIEKDKNEAVQEYINSNILSDPLHAQGVKRKAGISQSAFGRTDHVTNMAQQLEESM